MPTAATAAEPAAAMDHEVSNLASAAADASKQFSARDDCATDARADKAAKKVGYPLSGAEREFSRSGNLHVVAKGRRNPESFV